MTISCPTRDDLVNIYEIIRKDAESRFGKRNTFAFTELRIILDMDGVNAGIGQVNINAYDPSVLEMHLPTALDLKTSRHLNLFAHEVVHTLRYIGGHATKLEEGAATWFGKQYAETIRPWHEAQIYPDGQNYIDAYNAFNVNQDSLLRIIKDKFNDDDPATFSSFNEVDEVLQLGLNNEFNYYEFNY